MSAFFFTKSSVLRTVAGSISVVATSATMYVVYRAISQLPGYVIVCLAIAIFLIYLVLFISLLTLTNRVLINRFAAIELREKTEEIAAQLILACLRTSVFDAPDDDEDLIKREAWRPFKRFCD